MSDNYALVPHAVGTKVKITAGGLFIGCTGTVTRAYRIRFGHRMYDVTLSPGHVSTYHSHEQLQEVE
jgi:hypothetical protein